MAKQPKVSRSSAVSFCATSIGTLAFSASIRAQIPYKQEYRAAIIGATGQGNYGHELDLVFQGRQNVKV
ncbi:MAG: hypothetical protein ACO1QB_13825 [Verrucomicrobiales bacterium]